MTPAKAKKKSIATKASSGSKPESTSTGGTGTGRLKIKEDFIFPSTVWRTEVPGAATLNKRLLAEVPKLMRQQKTVKKSNVLGWHSSSDMHRNAAFQPLCVLIKRMADTIARSMKTHPRAQLVIDTLWINYNPRHAYNALHDHPDSVLSGVYYVQANENTGKLRFRDPRAAKRMAPWPVAPGKKTDKRHWDRVSLKPAPGRLVMFPSWLEHDVEANQSDLGRISVSFNLVFRKVNKSPASAVKPVVAH